MQLFQVNADHEQIMTTFASIEAAVAQLTASSDAATLGDINNKVDKFVMSLEFNFNHYFSWSHLLLRWRRILPRRRH